MKNTNISPELKELITAKGNLCVTMIIPLHELPTERKLDDILMRHAIDRLTMLLNSGYDTELVKLLMEKVRTINTERNGLRGASGMGLFMSPAVFRMVSFPFTVKEKIHVGSSFEVRDVLFKELYLRRYYTLSLTQSKMRLYEGSGGTLKEITDSNFPVVFAETDYSFPASSPDNHNNAAVAMQREKSDILESTRSLYNAIDRKMLDYLGEDRPLILAGVKNQLGNFESMSTLGPRIKGRVIGSYDDYNSAELEQKTWSAFNAYQQEERKKVLNSVRELFGRELVSAGIQNVWRDAYMGKGNLLVVEKDFTQPAFVSKDEFQIWLSPPPANHEIIYDAVDDAIEMVLEKDGRVIFVENGELADFKNIALIRRY